MKIGIHYQKGMFSEQWVEYCKLNNIDYKIVNAYDNDIVSQLSDCDIFMWHTHHMNYKDKLFAKQLLYSLQMAGKKVFPNFNTGWHFDDKLGQKYLLEAIGAPLVQSYAFYTKKEAMEWVEKTSFPKVFKLRGGAGSMNVRLIRTKIEAKRVINKAFGSGFPQFDRFNNFKERVKEYIQGKDTFYGVCKGFVRLFIPLELDIMKGKEKGYIYFQDFIPNQKFDFRVKVIGNYCWAFRREVKKNDFRASGSGVLNFDNSSIPISMIKTAFDISKKLDLQSIAYDFVLSNDEILLIEMSYCFGSDKYEQKNGYWDSDLIFHGEEFNPCYIQIENIINSITPNEIR